MEQQLQLHLPGEPSEERVVLEAAVEAPLLQVMAETIRAIVISDKETGHDHTAS